MWQALGCSAAIAAAATLRYSVNGRSARLFGDSVYCGERSRRSIALTFDDGPTPGSLTLLDYLERESVKATFFACGMNAMRHPGIVRRLHDMGHEIGNHTFSHRRLCPRFGWQTNVVSPDEIYNELASTQRILESETGVAPRWFRAPYGMRWWGLGRAQRRLGLTGVMWTVIGHDWEWDGDQVAEYVLGKASPGGIVCLHDGRDTRPDPDITETLRAVMKIVPVLKELGYRFETVSEIRSKLSW